MHANRSKFIQEILKQLCRQQRDVKQARITGAVKVQVFFSPLALGVDKSGPPRATRPVEIILSICSKQIFIKTSISCDVCVCVCSNFNEWSY